MLLLQPQSCSGALAWPGSRRPPAARPPAAPQVLSRRGARPKPRRQTAPDPSPPPPLPPPLASLLTTQVERSYSEAYDLIKGCKDPDVLNTAHPKVSKDAQALVKGATRIWGSDIYATGKGREFRAGGLLNMPTKEMPTHGAVMKNLVTCGMRCFAIGSMHVILALYGYR